MGHLSHWCAVCLLPFEDCADARACLLADSGRGVCRDCLTLVNRMRARPMLAALPALVRPDD